MINRRILITGAVSTAASGVFLPKTADAQGLNGLLSTLENVLAGLGLPRNVVYVQSNIAVPGQNSIFGFRRAADGSLTPLPGSPYPTGGTGFFIPNPGLGPFDTDQELVLDRLTGLLLSANGGSSSISILRINRDGSLAALPGSPFPVPGVNPVSAHPLFGGFVTLNADADPNQPGASTPSIVASSVTLGRRGFVSQAGTPIALPPGSQPTQILTDNTGPFIFTLEFFGRTIRSFIRTGANSLQQVDLAVPPAVPGAASPTLPLGLWASDVAPILYVGFATTDQIGVYRYSDRGLLTFLRAVPSSGQAPCWLRTGFGGARLYVIKTGDSSISVFDTTQPDTPREIQNLSIGGLGALVQFEISPDSRYLYVIEQIVRQLAIPAAVTQGNRIRVIAINQTNGTISEVTGAALRLPLPENTVPQGVIAL